MAHTERIPTKDLESIAAQIGRWLPAGLADVYAKEPPPVLAEHLPVVVLALEQVSGGKGPLRERVRRTGEWHCQIKRGDAAKDYALATEPSGDAGGGWGVAAVGRSALPGALQASIDWVEKNASGDPMVRLLSVPGYDVTALWLEQPSGDEVVVALAPKAYRELRTGRVYDGDAFVQILARYRPEMGVPRRPPRPRRPTPGRAK